MPEQTSAPKASADAYAAEHMATGAVLLRDKLVAGRTYQLLLLVPGLLFALAALGCVMAGLVVGGAALPALLAGGAGAALLAAMFGAMWITGTVIRTVVTKDELHVQAGLFGPRIPLQRIKSCRVGEQHNRLSTGVRFENGMWTSSCLLALGEYVEVVYQDPRGRDRRALFSATDPHAVARAIERAREGHAGAPARHRVAEQAERGPAAAEPLDVEPEERGERERRA